MKTSTPLLIPVLLACTFLLAQDRPRLQPSPTPSLLAPTAGLRRIRSNRAAAIQHLRPGGTPQHAAYDRASKKRPSKFARSAFQWIEPKAAEIGFFSSAGLRLEDAQAENWWDTG